MCTQTVCALLPITTLSPRNQYAGFHIPGFVSRIRKKYTGLFFLSSFITSSSKMFSSESFRVAGKVGKTFSKSELQNLLQAQRKQVHLQCGNYIGWCFRTYVPLDKSFNSYLGTKPEQACFQQKQIIARQLYWKTHQDKTLQQAYIA